MDQALINTIISIAAGAYGLVLKSMWDTIKSLDDQVGTLQVSVAGEYLKREESVSYTHLTLPTKRIV